MSFVIHDLYVGSLEDADNDEAMRLKNIKKLVSLGCSTSNNSCAVKKLSFEDVMDKPEQSIVSILTETNEYIRDSIAEGSAILVSDSKNFTSIRLKDTITQRLHYSRQITLYNEMITI